MKKVTPGRYRVPKFGQTKQKKNSDKIHVIFNNPKNWPVIQRYIEIFYVYKFSVKVAWL